MQSSAPELHLRSRAMNAVPPPGYHQPVLLAETLWALSPGPGRLIVDGTLGGGGHAEAILRTGAELIGLDRDAEAIAHASRRLAAPIAEGRARVVQANYRDLPAVLAQLGVVSIDGLLLDIGVSSRQLDCAERGFSFMRPGPLDMRMDASSPQTAADLVNHADLDELIRIFRELGEEPAARRVALAIEKERTKAPIVDTLALAALVETVIPKRGPRHPATRIFQALRLAVNDELGALAAGLEAAADCLRPGGRLAVITFHSLEDRLVKRYCRERSQPTVDRPEWPASRPNPRYAFREIVRRPIVADPAEQQANPRARSAKLRAVERNSSPI